MEMFDPLVVHREAVIVTVTLSGLEVPPLCSGGSNVAVPVAEQAMLPVATPGELVDELVEVELPVVDDVDVVVEVGAETVVDLWLLEQADSKTKLATSTTEAARRDLRGNENRIRAIVCSRIGANQRLSSYRTGDGS